VWAYLTLNTDRWRHFVRIAALGQLLKLRLEESSNDCSEPFAVIGMMSQFD
jgi:hypothetical protein